MVKNIAYVIVLVLFTSACNSQKMMIDNSVVKEFNVEKYLGTWYEIARYDHKFERGLVGVTANYSYRKDGKIKVLNAGFENRLDGKKSVSEGKAKIPDAKVPSKLKVSFFWFFYGDYFVLELDEDYQWAVIGSTSDKYLWILSRTPQMEQSIYADLLSRLRKRNYDVSKLILVDQKQD